MSYMVRLHRDALNTPWGLRLQGGKDFKTPLTVQRVFVGSPADGELHRGDVIESIQNYDASSMLHKQAQDLIKQAGGSLTLCVSRSPQNRARSAPPAPTPASFSQGYVPQPKTSAQQPSGSMYGYVPKPQPHYGGVPKSREFGQDYRQNVGQQYPVRGHGTNMLSRVNESLNQALWSPYQEGPGVDDPDYEQRSVGQLQHMFGTRDQQPQYAQRSVPKRKWVKPEPIPGTPKTLMEPGWTPKPKSLGGGTAYGGPGHTYGARPTFTKPDVAGQSGYEAQPSYMPQSYVPQPQLQQQNDYEPSWKGSLKSSGGPKPWEMRDAESLAPGSVGYIADQQQGPTPSPQYITGPGPADVQPHKPRVQNVHYGPGAASPEYQQHKPSDHTDSGSANVAHLQYNTPIGLYSRENVQAALVGQTKGMPGEGTMQVTGPGSKPFNAAQSDVYRMVLEEDIKHGQRKPAGHGLLRTQQQQGQGVADQQMYPQRGGYQGGGYLPDHNQQPLEDIMGTSDF